MLLPGKALASVLADDVLDQLVATVVVPLTVFQFASCVPSHQIWLGLATMFSVPVPSEDFTGSAPV